MYEEPLRLKGLSRKPTAHGLALLLLSESIGLGRGDKNRAGISAALVVSRNYEFESISENVHAKTRRTRRSPILALASRGELANF